MHPELGHRARVGCVCGRPLICPAEADHEISRINEMLIENGFEYPTGMLGVKNALSKLCRAHKDLLLINDRAAERIKQLEAELETFREQQK